MSTIDCITLHKYIFNAIVGYNKDEANVLQQMIAFKFFGIFEKVFNLRCKVNDKFVHIENGDYIVIAHDMCCYIRAQNHFVHEQASCFKVFKEEANKNLQLCILLQD